MERESFEDPATAALMNEHFVNVKVDREERPDVDAVYMDAVVALTGQGGWPMTVFLTPAASRSSAARTSRPSRGYGMPAFRDVLAGVAESWRERRERIDETAAAIVEHLRSAVAAASRRPTRPAPTCSTRRCAGLHDGLRPAVGRLGLRAEVPGRVRRSSSCSGAGRRELVETTLDGMAAGGMYDLVGGGFHRYSVDERWLVPHFEKMLYDNAQLAVAYLHGFLVLGHERYRRVAEQTVEYMLRELSLDGGGLASAQDADTDGVEGLTFTWAPGEGAPDELLQPFEDGRFVLRGELDEETRARLFELRERRPKPLARRQGDRVVERARARGARRVRAVPRPARLGRRRRAGSASSCSGRSRPPTAASTARGARASRRAPATSTTTRTSRTGSTSCTSRRASCAGSRRRTGSRGSRSSSSPTRSGGGFFQTPADGERLVVRKKELDDHPAPSGNSMLAYVLLRLARIYGDDELEERALSALPARRARARCARRRRSAGCSSRSTCTSRRGASSRSSARRTRRSRARRSRAGTRTRSSRSGRPTACRCSTGRRSSDGRPAVYVCERFACRAPVVDPAGLATA